MTSSTSATVTSARSSPAARARSTSCPTTSSSAWAPPSAAVPPDGAAGASSVLVAAAPRVETPFAAALVIPLGTVAGASEDSASGAPRCATTRNSADAPDGRSAGTAAPSPGAAAPVPPSAWTPGRPSDPYAERCCGTRGSPASGPPDASVLTRNMLGGSSRPAPEATEVRRKRDSADHGSSSWPRAVRACSVSREVSSSAIRLTSTSLLGKRR
ncbi:hypothetical protein DF17_28520 [Streptomyces rimosus]|nr:hypothetical protein DF17_28520 [Streptomyces rimosus]